MLWMEPDEWDKVIDTNLNGFYNLTGLVLKKMLIKRFGRIVNIVSLSVSKECPDKPTILLPSRGNSSYKSPRTRSGEKGVTVNAVAPGFIKSDMTQDLDENELKKTIPCGRFGTEEVAALTGFLVSKEAAYITGEVISINGGIYT